MDEPKRDLLCIASDLFNLRAPRPGSLDAVLERANDLIFASAGRRTISALRREYELRQRLEPNGPTVTLLHTVYKAAADQLSAKSFDFSPSSIRDRWAAGRQDMTRAWKSWRAAGRKAVVSNMKSCDGEGRRVAIGRVWFVPRRGIADGLHA